MSSRERRRAKTRNYVFRGELRAMRMYRTRRKKKTRTKRIATTTVHDALNGPANGTTPQPKGQTARFTFRPQDLGNTGPLSRRWDGYRCIVRSQLVYSGTLRSAWNESSLLEFKFLVIAPLSFK
jgi:hypothetical protein